MNTDFGSPDSKPAPQKIPLPSRSGSDNLYPKTPKKKRPGWLLPVGLIAFLLTGLVIIFLLRPRDRDAIQSDLVSAAPTVVDTLAKDSDDTFLNDSFAPLPPDELKALQKTANEAVKVQANTEKTHRFQDILFGKAASQLSEANSAMGENAFKDAQMGFEMVLKTVESLKESYPIAKEISALKNNIRIHEETLRRTAAGLLDTEQYQVLATDLIQADELLEKGGFQSALTKLKTSETGLKDLIETGEQQFQLALREGLKALNSGDGKTAAKHLAKAQDLRPGDSFVAKQLERAAVIDRVFGYFNQGLAFEQQGLLASARVEYQKALDLDPDSVNIATRLQDINQTLNNELFEEALAAGLLALTNGNGEAAVEQLEKATAFLPADTRARNALKDARELQRRQQIDRLLARGGNALVGKDWKNAQIAFQEVLDYEPASREAQRGLAEAEEQIVREKQLTQLVLEAESFEKGGEFEKALIVLREGRQLADPSGAVTEKINHLEGILEEQSQPQSVTIVSDNKTNIQIYKVGEFEPTPEINLELRPGEYTIVGSRLLYRDVRYTLKVEVGQSPEPLTVVCTEKL